MIQRLGPADATPPAVTAILAQKGTEITRLRNNLQKHFGSVEEFTRKCFGK